MIAFADLLFLAQLANAAYIDDAAKQRAAVEDMGPIYLGRYETRDHQAFVCQRAGRYILAIAGTRFSDGNVVELLEDEDILPCTSNPQVMAGFYTGGIDLFAWALGLIPSNATLEITGHSLGGARAHLAPLFVQADRITRLTSFGAPKAANDSYWSALKIPLTRVVHERDLWAGWPFVSAWRQPSNMVWLHDGKADETDEGTWPGGLWPSDHSIDKGYVPALAKLVSG